MKRILPLVSTVSSWKISPSSLQTREWRQQQSWYNNGKFHECERYQKQHLLQLLREPMKPTFDRIYFPTDEIISHPMPMTQRDGYEWSENWDGKLFMGGQLLYFNLKFVCSRGGMQTRTMREVYRFIKHQFQHMDKFDASTTRFINILDGDGCFHNKHHIDYIRESYREELNKRIFVGSLYEFTQTYTDFVGQKKNT